VRSRPGLSLLETLLALVLLGLVSALAMPPYVAQRDRSAVRAARTAAVTAFDQMRALALTRATNAAMRIDTAAARLVVHAGRDTVVRVEMFRAWGVRLAATRDSTAIAPDGLGYGAANLRLILSRGAAADSIIVSRLGRVTTR
jgi:Tfp pilus assembly protein PilE